MEATRLFVALCLISRPAWTRFGEPSLPKSRPVDNGGLVLDEGTTPRGLEFRALGYRV